MATEKGVSGQQKAEENYSAFLTWMKSASDETVKAFANGGQLHRKDLADHLGFSTSVFRQNSRISAALVEFEDDLRRRGVLGAKLLASSVPVRQKSSTDDLKRLKRLQEQNAHQAAEIEALKKRLAKFESLEEALFATGRIPR